MLNLAPIESAPTPIGEAEVLELINAYLAASRAAVGRLEKAFKVSNPLCAWRSGKLKQAGTIGTGLGTYRFHGVGCAFEMDGLSVDVDFGPDGRCDGFDA